MSVAAAAFVPLPATANGLTCTDAGPNIVGYRCASTTYSWADMSGATPVSLSWHSMSGWVSLPFAFNFHEQLKTAALIDSTGGLCFTDDGACPTYNGFSLYAGPNDRISCLGGDLDPGAGGTVKFKSFGSSWVVEFNNVPIPWGNPASFQIKLLSNGEVQCHFKSVTTVDGAAVGLKAPTYRVPGWSSGDTIAYADLETVTATNQAFKFYCTSTTPTAPTDFQHTNFGENGPGYLSLYWSYPNNDGCHKVQSYRVYSGPDASHLSFYTEFGHPDTMDTVWTDWSVPQGPSWAYAVRAVSGAGAGTQSPVLTFRTPLAPEGVSAMPTIDGLGHVKVTWQYPADDGGLDLSYNTIYRGPNVNSLQAIATVPGWATEYLDKDAPFGLQVYKVSATNPLGSSPQSASFGATGSVEPPAVFGDTQILDLGRNQVGPFAPVPITGSNCLWFDLGPITVYGSRMQNGNPSSWVNPGTPLLFGDRC